MNRNEFIDRYNALTGVFLRGFTEGKQDENIVFSPFSILSLLSILADSTGGSTRQEVLDLLYGDVQQQDFPEQLKAAREVLTRKSSLYDIMGYLDLDNNMIDDRSEHLESANAVIVKQEYSTAIRPEFKEYLSDQYHGILLSSPDLIEALKTRTPESVREMLPLLENIVDSDSVLAMINTVFFHAMWQYPYEGRNVRKGIFHNADHTDSKVTMLYDGGDGFVENDYATGFVKRFQQCDYAFMALLPKETGPDALRDVMNNTDFSELMEHANYHVILHSKMPEFKVFFRARMNEMLESLGVREAFTPEADFSSISSIPLMADQLVHQAKIEVDRNGARASAATAMILCGSLPPEEEKHVMIDRPFVFAVLHESLGIPVFVGVVNNLD